MKLRGVGMQFSAPFFMITAGSIETVRRHLNRLGVKYWEYSISWSADK